jgi:hypothetical protein
MPVEASGVLFRQHYTESDDVVLAQIAPTFSMMARTMSAGGVG